MRRVGPFELDTVLGSGGLGEVWRARHADSGEEVAVKLLRPAFRDRWRSHVSREVEAVARLDHPGIVWIHDHGDDPEAGPWMALELASGGTLEGRLPLGGWGEVAPLVELVLGALGHAHARGVLHRDLKPANLLLCTADDPRPGPKLADFGIAALGRVAPLRAGTPGYEAPEQAAGRWTEEGPWTDLYAVGALTWKLVCGPSGGWNPRIVVPEGLRDWLEGLLDPRPERRPPNAARALAALRTLPAPTGAADWSFHGTDERPADRPTRPTPRRSRASLRLFGWRPPPVVGRRAEQVALGQWLGGPRRLCVLCGAEGLGTRALVDWMVADCRERDRAWVLRVDADRRGAVAAEWNRLPGVARARDDEGALEALARWAPTADRPVLVAVAGDAGLRLAERLAGEGRVWALAVSATPVPETGQRRVLSLRPVDPAAFLRALGVVEPRLAAQIAEQVGGYPEHLFAVVAELVRRGSLVPADGRGYTLSPGAELPLPQGPADTLRARIAELPPCGAIRVAAVLGPDPGRAVWAATCAALGEPTDSPAWDAWCDAGLVSLDPDRVWLPPIVRALLDGDDGDARRIALAGAGAARASGDAEHEARLLHRAGRLAEAAPLLVAAAKARERFLDLDVAHRLLDLAASAAPALPTPEARSELVRALHYARLLLFANGGELERALRLIPEVGDPATDPRLRARRGQILLRMGRAEEALDDLVPAVIPAHHLLAAHALVLLGRFDEARRCLDPVRPSPEGSALAAQIACLENDAAAFGRAMAELRATPPTSASLLSDLLELTGAFLFGEPEEPPIDALLEEAVVRNSPYVRVCAEALACAHAASVAPGRLPDRVESARRATAYLPTRMALARHLFALAAELAPPEHFDALRQLAEGQQALPRPPGAGDPPAAPGGGAGGGEG